jgi:hypothetical protein
VLFACWINGELRFAPEGGTLDALEGDQLVLDGVWGTTSPETEILTLKGYVSQPWGNAGQDAGRKTSTTRAPSSAVYLEKIPGAAACSAGGPQTPGDAALGVRPALLPGEIHALHLEADGEDRGPLGWPEAARPAACRYRCSMSGATARAKKSWPTTSDNLAPGARESAGPLEKAAPDHAPGHHHHPLGSMTLTA